MISSEWQAPDGEHFSALEWRARGPERGVLIAVHGLGGAATDFSTLGQALLERGFSCQALNLRGQGLDPNPRRRGFSLDVETLIPDLAAFVRFRQAQTPELPLFLCGESLGALLVAALLGRESFAFPIAGAIFSVPVVDLKNPTPEPVRILLKVVAALFPRLRIDPSRFVSRKLGSKTRLKVTRDSAYEDFLKTAPHRIPVFSVAVLNKLGKLMDTRRALAAGIKIPALVLAAGEDIYVHPRQVKNWFDQLQSSDKEYLEYPEAFHLLWNDLDREKVLADILDWLEERSL